VTTKLLLTCYWSGTSITAHYRPDFLLWLGDLLIFWGEEKAGSHGAMEDLDKKFRLIDPVFFGDIKFMITYALNGFDIRFYAADGSRQALKNADPFIPLTNTLNLLNLEHRFKILQIVINIGRILLTITDTVPAVAYPIGKRKKIGDTEIAYHPLSVTKKILLKALPRQKGGLQRRIDFLADMYQYAGGHRGLVQVTGRPGYNKDRTHYRVELKTRGLASFPKTEDQLRQMTKDVVSGLSWLHQGRYLHCDVRSPNIVYDPIAEQYVLIDFEHGDRVATRKRSKRNADIQVVPLKEWDHETLENGVYTATSEMRQLRKMLMHDGRFVLITLSDQGTDFMAKLGVMTANESLEHEWIRSIA
jgi:hypothetical protein